ncbi:MAG: hypothetical protein AAF297_02645 [Planctomycetota bacterium]
MSKRSAAAIACFALAGLSSSGAAATVTTVDPGLYTGIDEVAEARVRLDGGNSQTWKLAFWDGAGSTPFMTNGNSDRDHFQSSVTESFQLDYDVASGQLDWTVGTLTISDVVLLDPGHALAGLKYFVTSDRDPGETRAENMAVSLNGGAAVGIADATASFGTSFFEPANLFFDADVQTFRLSGDLTFAWNVGANLQGDRFRLSVKLNQGLIPAPGAVAAFGFVGLAATRRRR